MHAQELETCNPLRGDFNEVRGFANTAEAACISSRESRSGPRLDRWEARVKECSVGRGSVTPERAGGSGVRPSNSEERPTIEKEEEDEEED